MISEYDLTCATCDGPLARHEVAPDDIAVQLSADADAPEPVPVAECENCGTRYYPTEALERLGTEAS